MTIRESSASKNFFAPKFFLNTLKKSWTNFLLYFIVLFFSFPVPILISTQSSYYSLTSEHVTFADIVDRVLNMLEDLNIISIFMGAAIAVFAGCVATRYLNSKTSTYFYHSLPVTREALYFTKVLTGVINYVSALVLTTLIGGLVLLMRIGASPEIAASLLSTFGYSILVFFTIFFITVFVGMFCGTTGVQFVMTGTLLFYLPATLSAVLLLMDEYMVYLDASWYFENVVIYTSPALRLFMLFDAPLSVFEIILFAVSAVIFAFLALLVYLRRGNENAGNPIVFPRAATFLKYLIMIPTTIVMGVWFGEMGGGLWQIFGFAAGAVLTFMLVNAVFTKNARAIFKGVRGLVVFSVIFGVCFLATVFDVLKYDEYIPSENLISRVEISINGERYGSYRDKEVWKSLKNDLKRYVKQRESGSLEYYYESIGYDTVIAEKTEPEVYEIKHDLVCPTNLSVQVVYYTKFGMPIAKYYPSISKDGFRASLKSIADSADFENYIHEILSYNKGNVYTSLSLQRLDKLMQYEYKTDGYNTKPIEAYLRDMTDISYESFQYPEVGEIYKRIRGGIEYTNARFNFPVLINCDNFFDEVLDGNDIYELYLDSIHSINVYAAVDYEDGVAKLDKMTITDRAQIKDVLSSVAVATDNHPYNVFCEYDYRYYVEIRYFSDAVEIKEDGKYVYDEEWIGAVSYFIGGKVPAFVENRLK